MTRKNTIKGKSKRRSGASNLRGKMKEFTPEEVVALSTILRGRSGPHAKRDYALFCVSVDMMARTGDILKLSFGDVQHKGGIVEELQFQQQKTGELAACVFVEETRDALASYVGKFSASIRRDKTRLLFPFTPRHYRNIVKGWADSLGLDPARYSGHSLRRTKAKMIYARTGNLMAVKELLGHTDAQHTQAYLDVERSAALDLAREISPLKIKS